MSNCNYEHWSLKELKDAINFEHKEKKIIQIPMFQRRIVWQDKQLKAFIDSLKKGFPIGTLLFSKTIRDSKEVYTLIDGLQRSNTIKDYIEDPTKYFQEEDVSNEFVLKIFNLINCTGNKQIIQEKIRKSIVDFIKSVKEIENIQYREFAELLSYEFPILQKEERKREVSRLAEPYLKKIKKRYLEIVESTIPIIVYSGKEENLPDIFERINNSGTTLNKYQVYAASWESKGKVTIKNKEIVQKILNKYDKVIENGFSLGGYNREELVRTKQFSVFEYVFGFGKYITDKYPSLFEKDKEEDKINPIAFELLNACLGKKNNNIKNLYIDLMKIDIPLFEERVIEVIEYIDKLLSPYTRFKGNGRKKINVFHAKYQMLSLISSTFIAKYDINNLRLARKSWKETKNILDSNIIKYYVFDIISKEWGEGGIGKIDSIIKNNKYKESIPKESWDARLNDWFNEQLRRQEKKKVPKPKQSDLIFMNCIYCELFTAHDQLSNKNFDVEHIVTKGYCKKATKHKDWKGIPISCIANLCYLPEYINRSKKEKIFYQDNLYLKTVERIDIEKKYVFLTVRDLEWTEIEYTNDDYSVFVDYYTKFLRTRFRQQKEIFYKNMNIV